MKALVYIQGGNKNNLQFINLPEEDKQKLDWIREKLLNIFDMDFSECMLSNVSNIALLLEYDALHTKRKNKVDDHLIVLQTNKLFLEENEASRVGNLVENSERN